MGTSPPRREQWFYVPSVASESNRAMILAGWALLSAEGSSFCESSFPKPFKPQDSCHSILALGFRKESVSLGLGFCGCCAFNETCSLFERVADHVQGLFGFLSGVECIGHLFSPGHGAGRGDLLSSLPSLSVPLSPNTQP